MSNGNAFLVVSVISISIHLQLGHIPGHLENPGMLGTAILDGTATLPQAYRAP